jgi:hypothetical protein
MVKDPETRSMSDCLSPVLCLQLFEHMLYMSSDGIKGDEASARNLAVFVALAEEFQDLELSSGKAGSFAIPLAASQRISDPTGPDDALDMRRLATLGLEILGKLDKNRGQP